MTMEVPTEMYLILFVMADELDVTKALRTVSKSSLKASYYYFKIILNQPLRIKFDGWWWKIIDDFKSDEELQSDIKQEEIEYQNRGRLLIDRGLSFEEIVGLKTTVKDLFRDRGKNLNLCNCSF